MPTQEEILVVDDEPGIRTLYEMLLSTQGIKVAQAQNCEQGLERYKADQAGNRHIRLVVSDYDTKTEMTGIEFYRRVVKLNPDTRFFLVTTQRPQIVRALSEDTQGRFRHFGKPLDFDEFLGAVREALGSQ